MTRVYDTATDLITFSRLQSQNTTSGSSYLGSDGLLKFAAEDEPRIEYGSDGSLKGLLIEEQRTNLLTESDFSANWTTGGTTLTPNAVSGLDGNTSAATLVEDTTNAQHFLYSSVAVSAGSDYTWSLVVQANGRQHFSLYPQSGTNASANFDLSAVTSSNDVTTNLVGHGVKLIAPDKYLCWITFTATGTTVLPVVYLRVSSGQASAPIYTGDGTSGLIIEATQLEEGSFATSYIPTSGSQQTRSADVASIPVTAFGYNDQAGTVVVEFDTDIPLGSRLNNGVFSLRDNSTDTDDLVRLYLPANDRLNVQVKSNNSSIFATDIQTDLPEQSETKVAIGFTSGSYAASVDGGAVQSLSASTTYPVADEITELAIGEINGSAFLNGHIKSLKYYPRRLTDAQLQELTS